MSKRKKSDPKPVETGYVLFNVVYEDGSQRSNRRVPRAALLSSDGSEEEVARSVIEDQDREIAEKAKRPPVPISKLVRSGTGA